jgi:hypothetical protein
MSAAELFNTPLEAGVRTTQLLVHAFPNAMSLDKLVVLDHIAVHTADFGGPVSLHPASPLRVAEPLVRRELVRLGLVLFKARGIIDELSSDVGFQWRAGDAAAPFIECLSSEYHTRLQECSMWTWTQFGQFTDLQVSELFGDRILTALKTEIAE